MLRTTWREAAKFDASQFDPRTALSCIPAVALPLLAGFWFGHREGMVAAGGAMSVGFGAWQRISKSRALPLLWASFGMSLAAFAGTLAGSSGVLTSLAIGGWGFCCGLLWAFDAGAWWVGLQCAIALLVAAAFPGGLEAAALRASLVLCGGLLQTLVAFIVRPDAADVSLHFSSFRHPGLRRALARVVPHIAPRSHAFHYALRLALTLGGAAGAARAFGLRQWYWVPMTALIVLKPELKQTLTRGFARLGGTLVGAALATGLAALLRPSPLILIALVIVFAALCYSLLNVNYVLYALCITAYVAFLLAFAGLPESVVLTARVLNTALGGVAALVSHWLLPPRAERHETG